MQHVVTLDLLAELVGLTPKDAVVQNAHAQKMKPPVVEHSRAHAQKTKPPVVEHSRLHNSNYMLLNLEQRLQMRHQY